VVAPGIRSFTLFWTLWSSPDADGHGLQAQELPTVELEGARSSDPDRSPLRHQWVQIAGPTAVIRDAGTARPEVDTPSIDEPTTISFRLTVTDSVGATDVNDVTVRVQPK